ncbi:hypothetical protein KAR91_71695, partial [Candidatus Pacearchaeota archaeon]|nr:hypothetical protein [Candidatus Pacearchaeota archaeon]
YCKSRRLFYDGRQARHANFLHSRAIKKPYFCQVEDDKHYKFAEYINEKSETIQELGNLAKKLDIVIIAALFERRRPRKFHNTAVVLDADVS